MNNESSFKTWTFRVWSLLPFILSGTSFTDLLIFFFNFFFSLVNAFMFSLVDFVKFFMQDLGEDHTDSVICSFFGLFLFLF